MELRIVSPCSATQCISLGECDEVRISWRELFPLRCSRFFSVGAYDFLEQFLCEGFLFLKHPDYIVDPVERSSRSHIV